jgi:TatD DNase family protein
MKFIDTHSHLYSKEFDADIENVISRAKAVLSAVYLPNIDLASIPMMENLAAKSPDFFFQMMGLHPCSVENGFEKTLQEMEEMLIRSQKGEGSRYYGIGETGLDLYWDKTYFEQQKEALQIQIDWAKKYKLPIILHARNAIDETIELIAKNLDENLRGIFHCYDGNVEQAKQIAEFKTFKMGVGGVVTYKKSTLPEVLESVDLQYLVLETDSPYLPPTPFRGKRNESSYTRLIAEKLAEIYDTNLQKIGEVTNQNAMEVFG